MKGTVDIEEDRTKVIENAQDISGLTFYTDGSGFEKGIGASVVMMRNEAILDSLKYYLGPDQAHTVYEAEATAVILALHLACNLKRKYNKITIAMDNQAVLLGLLNQKPKPSHYLMDKIHDLLEDFQVSQARFRGKNIKGYRKGTGRTQLKDGSTGWIEWKLKMQCKVKFIWTPGHEGILGNEYADEQAKLAAQGESSPTSELPPLLRRKPLPTSISATRQTLKQNAKTRWKNEWYSSPRHARNHAIDDTQPSDDYLSIIEQLRRNQASLLTQLRTGHAPLNDTLFRIKRATSSDCNYCGKGVRESIFHYLLICPHYKTARSILHYELGRKATSIPFLLGTRKGIPHLLHFISKTKRFRATFGEVRPDDDFVIKEKRKPKDVPIVTQLV